MNNSNIKRFFSMSTLNSTLDKVRYLSIEEAIEIIPIYNIKCILNLFVTIFNITIPIN